MGDGSRSRNWWPRATTSPPIASEAKRGERLLSPGARLDYAAIAVAASVGRSRLLVYRKPKVAILSTGDEIVDIDVPPAATQIRNSNTYSLAAQVQAAGGEPVLLPIAPDEPARLRELIADALESDLVLLAGGVSMGKYDLVESVLAEFQAEFFFTGVLIQPGKPAVFGRVPCGRGRLARESASSPAHVYFFGLPGNPVSTMVTFELFARPVLEALAGMTPRKLAFLNARLKSEIKTKTGLTAIPAGNPVRRIRKRRSGTGTLARLRRHGVHGASKLLYRDSAGPRANCSR